MAVLLGRAELSSLSDEATGARQLANRALSLVSGSGEWPLQSFYANLKLAELSLPDTEAAELHLDDARPFLEEMSLPQLRFGFDECLGRVRSLQGRRREAEVLFERAIEEIERVRGTVMQDSMRAVFLRDKSSVYKELLKLKLESGDAPAAFEVAERAKSRSLMDLLNGISDAAFVFGDAASEERLGVLQADLSAVYNMMLGGQDESEGAPPAPDLRGRAVELEEEIGRLRLRAGASPSTERDVFVSLDGYGADLPGDTVLLAYHVVGEEVIAFVSTPKDVRVMRGLGEVREIRDLLRRLDSQWDRFRSGRAFSERQARMLEKSTRRILAALYDALVGPLEPLLEDAFSEVEAATSVATNGAPRLAVVPHGPLHQAPFHAFFDGEGYLLERFEVSYAPSAAVFTSCQERRSGGIGEVMIAGVSDALIPAAREEALAVSELFPDARPLLDEHASLAAVSEAISGRSVVHLACHGMFRSDNSMFSGLKLHDGWMLASDVMKLELDGAIVALSACESGRNVVVGGDEILGLTRAFLGAKAATLLVSLWIVSDDTTASLMRRWYEKLLAGKPPTTALRESQLATMRDHPHPYYWSPFIIVGGR
ncbi:MAG: CHAT domain-containing protein [Rubrobacter sp.]